MTGDRARYPYLTRWAEQTPLVIVEATIRDQSAKAAQGKLDRVALDRLALTRHIWRERVVA